MKHWQAAAAAGHGVAAQEGETARGAAIPNAGLGRGQDWDQTLQAASRLRVLLGETRHVAAVTGIELSDGATALSASLALAMAELEQSPVLLVDGNSGEPGLHSLFAVNRSPGLLDVLDGRIGLEQALRQPGPESLFLLPIGSSQNSLASLLTAESAAEFLRAARERFRYVLLDAGLIRKSASAILLAAMSDGVVVALARGIRRHQEVAAFQQELENLKIASLGAVLTRTAARRGGR